MKTINNEQRIALEVEAGVLVVDTLLTAGYLVAVDNGEDEQEWTVEKTSDRAEILRHLRETDEDYIFAFSGGERVGYVYLVYGNSGFDTVSDYTVSLEAVIGAPAQKFYDENEGRLV